MTAQIWEFSANWFKKVSTFLNEVNEYDSNYEKSHNKTFPFILRNQKFDVHYLMYTTWYTLLDIHYLIYTDHLVNKANLDIHYQSHGLTLYTIDVTLICAFLINTDLFWPHKPRKARPRCTQIADLKCPWFHKFFARNLNYSDRRLEVSLVSRVFARFGLNFKLRAKKSRETTTPSSFFIFFPPWPWPG